jgi:hypothetical protein
MLDAIVVKGTAANVTIDPLPAVERARLFEGNWVTATIDPPKPKPSEDPIDARFRQWASGAARPDSARQKCPLCRTPGAYIGFSEVTCRNPDCIHGEAAKKEVQRLQEDLREFPLGMYVWS